ASSVLVRQAMRAAGQAIVTPDGIYELLRSTADSIYDSVTKSSYRRVNLERALDSLVGSGQPSLPPYITLGPGGQVDVLGTNGNDTFIFSGESNAVIVVKGAL